MVIGRCAVLLVALLAGISVVQAAPSSLLRGGQLAADITDAQHHRSLQDCSYPKAKDCNADSNCQWNGGNGCGVAPTPPPTTPPTLAATPPPTLAATPPPTAPPTTDQPTDSPTAGPTQSVCVSVLTFHHYFICLVLMLTCS